MKWTAKKIKAFRDQLGFTQKELAARLGVKENYIYMLEAGLREPSETLQLLLDCVKKERR